MAAKTVTQTMFLYLRLDDDPGVEHVTFQFEFSFIDQVERQKSSSIRAMKILQDLP
jgi:hypothetical protein